MDKAVEFVGFLLVLGFMWFVWPPLPLLGGGVLLVLFANTRSNSGRASLALGAAIGAFRRAYAAPVTTPEDGNVRRIA